MKSDRPRLVLGVTGSIAAFRSADLTSALTQAGICVDVVMTREATKFITALTLESLSKRPVITVEDEPILEGIPAHIALADSADLVLVAPASANLIAQAALGLSGEVLTSLLLATRAPIWMAPAMNGKMWEHPATVLNVSTLKSRGVQWIGPESGLLACGYEGTGRMATVAEISQRVIDFLKPQKQKTI
ncbi:MAG: flavoprotein [Verrucomicrobiota bacterium]